VTAYLRETTLREPDALRRLRESTQNHSHADWQIAPEQGQFLQLLTYTVGARKALEIGVFMGYSSTWMALALPAGGKLVACDLSEEYTLRARRTWTEAGVEDRIDLRIGPALRTLDALIAEGQSGTFDLAFIDADKEGYDKYYERSLTLLRQGGLIVADNVLRRGAIANANDPDTGTIALREFLRKLRADSRVAFTVATMGDGFALACKL
jgi:caffeoyl-CoA O-methyltransferase